MDFEKTYGSRNPKDQADWFEKEGASFLIAPAGNLKQQELLQQTFTVKELIEMDQNGGVLDNGQDADSFLTKMKEISAKSLLLDWKGVYQGDKEVKYSLAKAIEYLKYEQFANWVAKQSQELADNANKKEQEIEKK
jgi:hypothetical protein